VESVVGSVIAVLQSRCVDCHSWRRHRSSFLLCRYRLRSFSSTSSSERTMVCIWHVFATKAGSVAVNYCCTWWWPRSFNGHFRTMRVRWYQDAFVLDTVGARVMEVVLHWSYKMCAKLQSNCHHQHTALYRPDALPVTQPTVSKHW